MRALILLLMLATEASAQAGKRGIGIVLLPAPKMATRSDSIATNEFRAFFESAIRDDTVYAWVPPGPRDSLYARHGPLVQYAVSAEVHWAARDSGSVHWRVVGIETGRVVARDSTRYPLRSPQLAAQRVVSALHQMRLIITK